MGRGWGGGSVGNAGGALGGYCTLVTGSSQTIITMDMGPIAPTQLCTDHLCLSLHEQAQHAPLWQPGRPDLGDECPLVGRGQDAASPRM